MLVDGLVLVEVGVGRVGCRPVAREGAARLELAGRDDHPVARAEDVVEADAGVEMLHDPAPIGVGDRGRDRGAELILDLDRDTRDRCVDARVVPAVAVDVREHHVTEAEAEHLDIRLVGAQDLGRGRAGANGDAVDIDVARSVAKRLERQRRGHVVTGGQVRRLHEPHRADRGPVGRAGAGTDLGGGAPQTTGRAGVGVSGHSGVVRERLGVGGCGVVPGAGIRHRGAVQRLADGRVERA